MAWLQKSKKSWLHTSCEYILKTGPIPRHVAFIMDGNRRFANKNSLECAQGHIMGFDKLAEVRKYMYIIYGSNCNVKDIRSWFRNHNKVPFSKRHEFASEIHCE